MNVINMLEDFRLLVEESEKIGKWEAFKHYYEKYPQLWEKILGYLYMINLEGMYPTIEGIDFQEILTRVEENLEKIPYIEELVEEVAIDLGLTEEFDLYIGVGLGHINGTALPQERPMLYIGLECIGQRGVDLDYLIPHEMNHLARCYALKEINPNAFRERVITEGIGTIYPLLFNKKPITQENIATVLFMTLEQVNVLLEQEDKLTRKVFEKMEFDLTPELMKKFFIANWEDDTPQLAGYFVGLRMIQRLIESGKDIRKLTRMPATEIISKYQETL